MLLLVAAARGPKAPLNTFVPGYSQRFKFLIIRAPRVPRLRLTLILCEAGPGCLGDTMYRGQCTHLVHCHHHVLSALYHEIYIFCYKLLGMHILVIKDNLSLSYGLEPCFLCCFILQRTVIGIATLFCLRLCA